ncbi:hypothetical protein JNUCC1_00502 [Lentibacillus sp. JNUCC-1]|uniref:DUF1659 domain-containing protein n=1 Tax=Lentibacillus sp. JNUCC-1 TaxID=2654513 RepID=UPI0012E981DE|nr:DUF1659 domain-containing protein [Lentibacillus sp. JNUCC-1]MUV36698.1 hypothetical protein [Lentibacillus sp. JNUCC-1]
MGVEDKVNSSLRLVLYDGDDLVTGKPIYKAKTFNNVKTDATADQLYAIANALAALQERPLSNIERRDTSNIHQA